VRQQRNGPERLLGSFELLILLKLISAHPGIYGTSTKRSSEDYGVVISVPSTCRTLKEMGAANSPRGYAAI